MSESPIYTSRSTAKRLWHEYRIYDDRVELDTGLGTMTVPFEHVERVEVSPPHLTAEALRLHFHPFLPALKLDWADFTQHVFLDRDTGLLRRVEFTPEDPAAFKTALDAALERWRRNTGKSDR